MVFWPRAKDFERKLTAGAGLETVLSAVEEERDEGFPTYQVHMNILLQTLGNSPMKLKNNAKNIHRLVGLTDNVEQVTCRCLFLW